MHCLIVAGGSPDELPDDLNRLDHVDMIVCADGGVHNARRLGLDPDIVVGDLDSLDRGEKTRLEAAGARFVVHPAAKDETDLELALLWCAGQQAQQITVLGAFGGRPDHLLANLLLLADERLQGIQVCVRSRHWQVWMPLRALSVDGQAGDTVSLIPISATVGGVWTEGLEYPLRGDTLRRGPARGVSNVMLGEKASVRFDSGLLAVMHGPPQ